MPILLLTGVLDTKQVFDFNDAFGCHSTAVTVLVSCKTPCGR